MEKKGHPALPKSITLRDYFAGMALAKIAGSNESALALKVGYCYDWADAMLKERERRMAK